MIMLSRYFGLPLRIFMILGMVAMIVTFIFKFFIPIHEYIGSYKPSPDLIPFYFASCYFLLMFIYGFYFVIKAAEVSCDGNYFYIKNLTKIDKVPISNLDSYYIDLKGFNLRFRSKTNLGTKIFFQEKYFQRKKVKKYLNELKTVANERAAPSPGNSHFARQGERY